jgi:hypothetical protein
MQGKNMYYAVKGTIRLDFDWLVVLVILQALVRTSTTN